MDEEYDVVVCGTGFLKQLHAEGLHLQDFPTEKVAWERLDRQLDILQRCRAVGATFCLVMEDFVRWQAGDLIDSLQAVVQLQEFDVVVLGRNEREIRCDDIEATFEHLSRLKCTPLWNYALVIHERYYTSMLSLLQEGTSDLCGFQTDLYFAVERLYRIPSSAIWYVASPLPVQVLSQPGTKGHFAARCAFAMQSRRPIIMLHPMRTGGTSVCDVAAKWYLLGGRGGSSSSAQNCRAESSSWYEFPGLPEQNVPLRADQVNAAFAGGAGFIALEPSYTDWYDGFEPRNISPAIQRWYGAMARDLDLAKGFWHSYLTILLVRDPIERYLSWLRWCLPDCGWLRSKREGDADVMPEGHSRRCFEDWASKFIELLLRPRLSTSGISAWSPLRFEHIKRSHVPGCRGYNKGYHIAQASNCLTRHLLPRERHLKRSLNDSDLEMALSMLQRFDVASWHHWELEAAFPVLRASLDMWIHMAESFKKQLFVGPKQSGAQDRQRHLDVKCSTLCT
ncbi:unnamed protein product [Durusdinium trenchii]|uniref:Uncharacterized protein n=2 Tax=Durusdinium trenchii TaxID=1381693 RepID=A0ABP0NJ88_9DINO